MSNRLFGTCTQGGIGLKVMEFGLRKKGEFYININILNKWGLAWKSPIWNNNNQHKDHHSKFSEAITMVMSIMS